MRLPLLCLGSLLLFAAPLVAQTPGSSEVTLETALGLQGWARAGAFCPVRVTLGNSGTTSRTVTVVATGMNADDVPCAVRHTVELPPGSKKHAWLLVPSWRLEADEIAVSLEDEKGAVLQRAPDPIPTVTTTSGWFVVVVGSRSLGLAPVKIEDRAPVVPVLLAPAELPDRWAALAGVDAILWHAPSAGEFESPAQIRALLDWTAAGGTLVLCGIDDPNALAALPLDAALPARPRGSVEVTSLKSMGEFAGHPAPICTAPVLVTECSDLRGGVLQSERGLPILIVRAYGTGRVILMTVDPAREPLARWGGMDPFWRRLLGIAPDRPEPVKTAADMRRGRAEAIARSLRASGITPMPFGRVFLLLCVYLAVIGPLDYFLLKRLGHLEWTWFTLPCWVMLFSLVVYLVSRRGREEQALLHEVSVCDVASDRVSAWTWTAVCRPTTGPVSLVPVRGPGATLPLSSGGAGSNLFGRSLDLREEAKGTRLEGVPVAAWDWALARTAWSAEDLSKGGFAATGSTGGEIRIQNRTGWDLTEVECVTKEWVQAFPEWKAGGTVMLGGLGSPGVERMSDWATRNSVVAVAENPSAPDGDVLEPSVTASIAVLTWLRLRLDPPVRGSDPPVASIEAPRGALPADCSSGLREGTVVIVARWESPPAVMVSPGAEGRTRRFAVVRSVVEVGR
ncbi:MAG: hypothetical protein HYY93_09045 [Planctomycetes bacterium]|nr:hypothetical protein [Planctomycetota bacterium]